MIKARRTITAVCLATLMTATSFSTITPFPQTTITAEAASTISIEQAGKKIAKAQDKAFNTKKDVTVTVKVKCSSKKKADDIELQIVDAVARAELGDAYNRDAGTTTESMYATTGSGNSLKNSYDYTMSFKSGILTIKFIIHGGKKAFQKAYRNNACLKQNVADLKNRVKGMDEKDKAWEVALWVRERSIYNYEHTNSSDEAVYKGKAEGTCSILATLYLKYALLAGVEKPGKVLCHAENHDWNCVKIDGETYYLDIQSLDELNGVEYNYINENIDSTDEKIMKQVEFRRTFSKDGGYFQGDATEVSKGEYCLLTEEHFRNYADGIGKPSQWKYQWKL